MKPIYCALVHHPVIDRLGDQVTTAVTNIDVHDLARSARTYDLAGYFVVTPITAQRALTQRIVDHWTGVHGPVRIPSRTTALERVRPIDSLEAAIQAVELEAGATPRLVATAARSSGFSLSTFADERERLESGEGPTLIVFGTGHGLSTTVLEAADVLLEPIHGRGDSPFNHLSVRAAFAIILDRLLGAR
jgi:hypothetical protein